MARYRTFKTGNSHTNIRFDGEWQVLDLGSGHNPHPRADVLVDKFYLENAERSGQPVDIPEHIPFVIADAVALPFKDYSFDFVICSHVAEHIEDIDAFCNELNRVATRGYLETPSKFAETLRHPPNHRWFVSEKGSSLRFTPAPGTYPLGSFGKLFFSLYFYGNIQAQGRDVHRFADGVRTPGHYVFLCIRVMLVWLWLFLKPLTYTRFKWEKPFKWYVEKA